MKKYHKYKVREKINDCVIDTTYWKYREALLDYNLHRNVILMGYTKGEWCVLAQRGENEQRS